MCGFDAGEAQRICRILCSANSLACVFDERLLSESAGICDAVLIKLASLSPDGLRAAATSPSPILVTGSSQALLEGVGAAYLWHGDFMNQPFQDAELLLRLYRLIGSAAGSRAVTPATARTEPLVLLADDDPELIALVDVTLRTDGIGCRTADNGLVALRLAREIMPDLIILDVKMPGMSGFEVLETIRRDPRLRSLPVILLTGCDDPADIRRGSELGANQYIAKPVSPNILLNRVKQLLSTHADNSPV